MIKKFICFVMTICLLGSSAFAITTKEKNEIKSKPSAKEIQAYQIHDFHNVDEFTVMKALINTLQDNYYFIEHTDSKIGVILAVKEFDTRDKYIDIKKEFGCSKKMTGIKRYSISRTEVNINVQKNKNDVKVRTSFRKKILNMYDVEIRVEDITDSSYYEDFYKKLEQAVNDLIKADDK